MRRLSFSGHLFYCVSLVLCFSTVSVCARRAEEGVYLVPISVIPEMLSKFLSEDILEANKPFEQNYFPFFRQGSEIIIGNGSIKDAFASWYREVFPPVMTDMA
jgi:hypothetical protein